jgi:hypothetical protein
VFIVKEFICPILTNHLISNKEVWILNSQVFVIIVEKMTIGKENASTQKAMPQESYEIWI